MQGKSTVVVLGSVAVIALGLLGWQSWNTHQLQQQVASLQQQVSTQAATTPVMPNHPNPLAMPAPQSTAPGSQINPQLLAPAPAQPSSPQGSAPLANGPDPFWGNEDPFEEMQRMQQQMHEHMQQLMNSFGMSGPGASLFDMDPFQGGPGFGSSMGFGAEPEFEFKENGDHYEVSISIPQGSNVEINTSTQGNNLTIEGKVTVEQNNQSKGNAFRSQQTRQFARTLHLPEDVDPLGLTHETRGDHVVITLPKKQGAKL
jgi:HSP20 family molecular chaperone IbpA